MSQFILPSRATDANNNPLSGAKLYFFLEGTATPATVYTDAARLIPHPHPVVADSGGLFTPIYLDRAVSYRATLKTAGGSILGDYDPFEQGDEVDFSATTGAAYVGTADGSTVQAKLNKIGTENLGTLPAGGYTPFVITKTAAANAAANSDWRAITESGTITGAFGAQQFSLHNFQHNILHTAGTVTYAYGLQGYSALGVPSTVTTTGNVSSIRGFEWHISHTGTGTVGDAFACYMPGPDLDVGTGLVTNFVNYRSGDLSGGAGTNRISGTSYGYFQANSSIVTTPIMAAYGSEMSSGTGRWNIYFTGSAPNSWAGNTRIGDNALPVERLEVLGNIKLDTGGVLKVGADQVVGARSTGTPANATDLATAITLVNSLKAKLVAHGLIA